MAAKNNEFYFLTQENQLTKQDEYIFDKTGKWETLEHTPKEKFLFCYKALSSIKWFMLPSQQTAAMWY